MKLLCLILGLLVGYYLHAAPHLPTAVITGENYGPYYSNFTRPCCLGYSEYKEFTKKNDGSHIKPRGN